MGTDLLPYQVLLCIIIIKTTMKADKIFKNAKIFTADKNQPRATALAVKDGKFIYVGDEAGLQVYEGEVTDLATKAR